MRIATAYIVAVVFVAAALVQSWRKRGIECAEDRALRKTNRSYGYR